ncbi:MAG TPA: hypothetical protein VF845_12895, partial [Terriglobales bacterium]
MRNILAIYLAESRVQAEAAFRGLGALLHVVVVGLPYFLPGVAKIKCSSVLSRSLILFIRLRRRTTLRSASLARDWFLTGERINHLHNPLRSEYASVHV